ncbi:hypothetical protein K439DRAFT_1349111, partial [Ramaria rubella]
EWEHPIATWDSNIKHYWQARHVKVIEFSVTACGIPLTHTKFPVTEGEHEIAQFMTDVWPPDQPAKRPGYIVIDKACKVMLTLNQRNELLPPDGGLATTRLKVEMWHYTCHGINELCVSWCNLGDRHDPNLIHVLTITPAPDNQPNAQGHSCRAPKHLNAWLKLFGATLTKVKPNNQDMFLNIILTLHARMIMDESDAL